MLLALGRLMFEAALLEISARGSSCLVLRGVCTLRGNCKRVIVFVMCRKRCHGTN